MTEIKSCPFCGGKAKIKSRQIEFCGQNEYGQKKVRRSIYVVCNKCYSRGRHVTYIDYKDNMVAPPYVQDEAIDHWNRRV